MTATQDERAPQTERQVVRAGDVGPNGGKRRTMRQPTTVVRPVVQRIRIRYAKRGRMRFASHRDFQRALERAVRRGRLPVAFSAGFSPHPRISYANAVPTGAASEAEYVEIALQDPVDPAVALAELAAIMPPGLDLCEAVVVSSGPLPDRLEVSDWLVRCWPTDVAALPAAIETFLAAPEVVVERTTGKGVRAQDVRAAVLRMELLERSDEPEGSGCGILRLAVRNTSPTVRPEDVLAGLAAVSGLVYAVAHVPTRVAQGPWDPNSGTVGDPLDADRDATHQSPGAQASEDPGHEAR